MSQHWQEKAVKTVRVKLHNRRVRVSRCRNGAFKFTFTKLEDGKPIDTRLGLSEEATYAMCACVRDLVNAAAVGRRGSDVPTSGLLADESKGKA